MTTREEHLNVKFCEVLSIFDINTKNGFNLSFEQLVTLKSALSTINNLITLRLTIALADWICKNIKENNLDQNEVISKIQSTKPNTNGFDIEIPSIPLVAEVKCCIPINRSSSYGVAQRNSIKNDIDHLLNGKKKSQIIDIKEAIKILGLYKTTAIEEATDELLKNLARRDQLKFTIVNDDTTLTMTDAIYVVFLEML